MAENESKMTHRHKLEARNTEKEISGLKKKNKKWSKAEVKAETERLRSELQARHEEELATLRAAPAASATDGEDSASGDGTEAAATAASASATSSESGTTDASEASGAAHKPSRAAKRRAKKEAEARAREEELDKHYAALAAAGGSRRDRELTALQERLGPLGLHVVSMPADGSCMFHALADQLRHCGSASGEVALPSAGGTAEGLRRLAADGILAQAAELGPYLPFDAADGDYAADASAAVKSYCDRLRSTASWGGQPEARALCEVLGRPIVIHRAASDAVVIQPSGAAKESGASGAGGTAIPENALHLTFHEHFISSGEHYNSARRTSAE